MTLHTEAASRLDQIERIVIETQEPGVRIIDKTGPLNNPADRDHCIQYMVAVPLIFGRLNASDYDDAVARDPRIDALRARMQVIENRDFTRDYYDPAKRFIGNAIQLFYRDGSCSRRVAVDYPIGHRLRRAEGLPLLRRKFEASVRDHFPAMQAGHILHRFSDRAALEATSVNDMMSALIL
jgi:2-methylcitrate dehydratase PrpD